MTLCHKSFFVSSSSGYQSSIREHLGIGYVIYILLSLLLYLVFLNLMHRFHIYVHLLLLYHIRSPRWLLDLRVFPLRRLFFSLFPSPSHPTPNIPSMSSSPLPSLPSPSPLHPLGTLSNLDQTIMDVTWLDWTIRLPLPPINPPGVNHPISLKPYTLRDKKLHSRDNKLLIGSLELGTTLCLTLHEVPILQLYII